MGLDMYLYTNSRPLAMTICRKANSEAMNIADENYKRFLLDYNSRRASYGEVMYWRKANAIHGWFIDNVQHGNDDCRTYRVDYLNLKDLLETIDLVLEDPSRAEELLPTADGFFFGDTNYDDEYFQILRDTKDALEFIFSQLDIHESQYGFEYVTHPDEPDWHVDFYYESSW